MSGLLEPDAYYDPLLARHAGYELVYYVGLDPYFLGFSGQKRDCFLDLFFLLCLADFILLSPSAIFGPFFQARHRLNFFQVFWQDNTLTTSIWHDYQHHLDDFIQEQFRYKGLKREHITELNSFFRPTGETKALFIRHPMQQSSEFRRLFHQTYRHLFLQNRHQNSLWSDWTAPGEAEAFLEKLYAHLDRQKSISGIRFNRAQMMEALHNPVIIGDFPEFISQGATELALFSYSLSGCEAHGSYLFPQLPPQLKLYLPPKLNELAGSHFQLPDFVSLMRNYRIYPHELHQLSAPQFQKFRIQNRQAFQLFRAAFKNWVNRRRLNAESYFSGPIHSPHGQRNLLSRFQFMLEDFPKQVRDIPTQAPKYKLQEGVFHTGSVNIKINRSEYLILKALFTHQLPHKPRDLAEQLFFSEAAVRKTIQNLRSKLKDSEFSIHTASGKQGYILFNPEKC